MPTVTRTCSVCGLPYEAQRIRGRGYCSGACSARAHRVRTGERMAAALAAIEAGLKVTTSPSYLDGVAVLYVEWDLPPEAHAAVSYLAKSAGQTVADYLRDLAKETVSAETARLVAERKLRRPAAQ